VQTACDSVAALPRVAYKVVKHQKKYKEIIADSQPDVPERASKHLLSCHRLGDKSTTLLAFWSHCTKSLEA
jgi:hypothetical protein